MRLGTRLNMPIDYTSLLVAQVFACVSIFLAALLSWRSTHKDNFILAAALGVGLIGISSILMAFRHGHHDLASLLVPYVLLLAGSGVVYASARLFRHKTDLRPAMLIGAAGIVMTVIPLVLGWLGLAVVLFNIAVAVPLVLSAGEFWGASNDMRSSTRAIAGLFFFTALSFLASAISRMLSGEWIAYPPADTFIETVNAIMSLIGISGIGALTLMLHFARAAHQQQTEANTDALTGVLNRRALFERFAESDIIPGLPVLLFDLDHFKTINDHLGHAEGDRTLQKFGEILLGGAHASDVVARIGGEEFCMVLPGRSAHAARARAEEIRTAFSALAIPSGRHNAIATVSVGVATCGSDETLVSALGRADAALYKAKSEGRNKVSQHHNARAA